MATTKKKEIDLEIVNLKVMLHTNKDSIIELTSNLFLFDGKTGIQGNYPLLCTNYRYSKELLNYKTLYEIVQTFFNRNKFNDFILASKVKKTQILDKNTTNIDITLENKINVVLKKINKKSLVFDFQKIKALSISQKNNIINNLKVNNNDLKKITDSNSFVDYLILISNQNSNKNKIIKENIIIMLNALFPVSFPIKDQVSIMDDNSLELLGIIQKIFKSSVYVYLNIDKPSTVIQVKWLNTIASNPTYYQLYKMIKKYQVKLYNYLDENVKNGEIKKIFNRADLSENEKIKEIKKKVIQEEPKDSENDKNIWDLYFLFSKLKKNTKEYNNFIKKYIQKFISDVPTYGYSYSRGDNDQLNEKKFLSSIPELNFHFEFMEKIIEYLPPKRISTSKSIISALNNKYDFDDFVDLFEESKDEYSGVEKVNDGKDYEIHVGIAVVGGKVTGSNYKFWCKYNSYKLGNDLNYLIKNTEEDPNSVRLYSYIDLENVNSENEYTSVVNSSVKKVKPEKRGGRTCKKNKRVNQRTRKL